MIIAHPYFLSLKVMTVCLSAVSTFPQKPVLQSLLPLDPIEVFNKYLSNIIKYFVEDPPQWAWAGHPSRGFSYKSKDSLSVEFCLENPKYISTAR